MTYLQFLIVFLILPIVAFCVYHTRKDDGTYALSSYKWVAALSIIAFVYTTPWDNYLVYRGVWYYGAERVIGTIAYVPLEEYLFFLLQPILTGAWLLAVLRGSKSEPHVQSGTLHLGSRPLQLAFWAGVLVAGVALLYASQTHPEYTYLGLILAWASPVLIGMAWLSADTFSVHRRAWIWGVSIPTLYLWIADRYAIGAGIWDISDRYSLDWDPLGLPVEEAVFFLVTNILVVQGLLMLLTRKDDDSFAITA